MVTGSIFFSLVISVLLAPLANNSPTSQELSDLKLLAEAPSFNMRPCKLNRIKPIVTRQKVKYISFCDLAILSTTFL